MFAWDCAFRLAFELNSTFCVRSRVRDAKANETGTIISSHRMIFMYNEYFNRSLAITALSRLMHFDVS